ncbi:hypothetical protein [Marinobacterium lacunae]|uniref:hypothetical protein n=1 Tax=Marinobacterium lacunae TaxID=1232683 RepID=UPI00056BA7FC|nr:hypothetical protein [Marinobacterium lacunae]
MVNTRILILFLVVLSVVVTWYIESGKIEVPSDVRARVEAELSQDSTFPARPVWWDKGHRLGVGVIPDGTNRDSAARRVCNLMLKHGISPAEVEVYDVLQIQNDDEWVQVGAAQCE